MNGHSSSEIFKNFCFVTSSHFCFEVDFLISYSSDLKMSKQKILMTKNNTQGWSPGLVVMG